MWFFKMNWVRVSGLKLKLKQGGMQEIHKNCTFFEYMKKQMKHITILAYLMKDILS